MPRPFVFLVYVMSLLNYPVESLYDVFFLCQISWKAAATSILAASSLVSAVPLQRRGTKMMTSKTRFNAAGAVYCECNQC